MIDNKFGIKQACASPRAIRPCGLLLRLLLIFNVFYKIPEVKRINIFETKGSSSISPYGLYQFCVNALCHYSRRVGMNDGDRDERVLEGLERVTAFFICQFFTQRTPDEAPRHVRVRLLPDPAPACSLLSSLRIIYLAAIAHSCIRQNRVLTKRDIYYMCRKLFNSPATVDRALEILSSIVGVDRNDLNVVAAPKGIVVGNVLFVDESANEVNVAMFGIDGCLIPSRPERMVRVSSNARAIIVIEKEASLHCLLHEEASKEFFRSCVLVTGKGYPDYATRQFLKRLIASSQAREKSIPTYILTDADPHGICIAMCYLSSLSEQNVTWVGVKPSDVDKDFQLDSRSRLPLQQTEATLLSSLLKRCSSDFHKDSTEYNKFEKELGFIKSTGFKFEMEALSVARSESGVSGLLHYLISKICDEEEFVNPIKPSH